jgi:hypothetical protein
MTVIKPSLRSYISGECAQLSNKIATYLQSSSLAQGSTRRALEEDEGRFARFVKTFMRGGITPKEKKKLARGAGAGKEAAGGA